MVFAPITLQNALDAVLHAYDPNGKAAIGVYEPASALVQQMHQGGHTDIFLSADTQWMDRALGDGLIGPASRFNLVAKRMVPAGSPAARHEANEPRPPRSLVLLDGAAWHYAIRIRTSPAPAVFATDIQGDSLVQVIAIFPTDSLPALVYPAALTRTVSPSAARLMAFLHSVTAIRILALRLHRAKRLNASVRRGRCTVRVTSLDAAATSPYMLLTLYRRILALAASPNAGWWLCLIAFAEASFFPIPPDALLVAMALAKPRLSWRYAAICTIGSVAGGALGYLIGYAVFDQLARPILGFYGYGAAYTAFQAKFQEYGLWIILIKGLTPIPYKIVTIAAGAARFDFLLFMAASALTRGARFFLVATLLKFFGDRVRDFIERRLTLVTSALAIGIVGGFLALKLL